MIDHGSDEPLWRVGAMGADGLGLEVDAERGTLLRVESRFQRQPFRYCPRSWRSPLTAACRETFVFTPPPGEQQVRSIDEQFGGVRRDFGRSAAVALAPFVVLDPGASTASWETQIAFVAAQIDRRPHRTSFCTIAPPTERTA